MLSAAVMALQFSVTLQRGMACSCPPTPPPCQAYGQSPMVFLGTITDALATRDGRVVRARMRVDRDYKGTSEGTLVVFDDGPCDGPELEVGQHYLMYTHRLGDGDVPSRGCTRSRNVKYAAEDLQYLDALDKAAPTGTIFGQVAAWPEGRSGDTPIQGAAVVIQGQGDTLTTMADGQGHYSFSGLKPAAYKVSASLPGFRMPSVEHEGVEAKVEARGCAVADVAMRKNWPGTIRGSLMRPDGTPAMAGIDLNLIRVEGRGKNKFSKPLFYEEVQTNEQGEYSFLGVAPGRYKVVVHALGFPTPAVPYPQIYWPSASTEPGGSEIRISNAAVSRRFNFRLPPEVKSTVVSGVVLQADGRPAGGAKIQILKLPDYAITGIDANSDAAGHFSFTAMDGFDYSITAIGIGERPASSAELDFSLRNSPRFITLVLDRLNQN
jgi:hypothetical protein